MMDYSTISNKTNTDVDDLTGGEVSEKYYLLRKEYDNLSRKFDAVKQELHDVTRSYQTALDVQGHLNADLESFQEEEKKRRNELNSRITSLQEELSTLRQERAEVLEQHAKEIKKLELDNKRLKEERNLVSRQSPVRDTSEIDDIRAALSVATSEAADVKVALEEARAQVASWQMKFEELVTEMSEIRKAADVRREELNAAGEREAAALADLAEARALLHQAESQDALPHAAKGNSLFAEVEDKRQEMAKNLIQMKQTNSRLRRDLANKQAEVEALLHEKHTVWEQQAGAAAHHDRELIEGYEERITQLEGLCERRRRELAQWFARAADSSGWLPAVLRHQWSECERLRAEVLSRGAAELASAAQVRELRRKLALQAAHSPPTRGRAAHSPPTGGRAAHDADGRPPPAAKKPLSEDVRKKVSFN